MTDTPDFESKAEYMRRMSDDGAGGLEDQAGIEANIASSFTELGGVATDVGDIPGTATVRPSGSFTDANAAHQYLENGGLVVTDGAGNVEPIGFVWFLKEFDDILYEWLWTVYIDEDTG